MTVGSSQAPPSATVRAERIRSSPGASFSWKPEAPARKEAERTSSSSNVVRTSTGGASGRLRRRRVASAPPMRFMRTSMITRSGRWASTADSTSSPSLHSATTWKPSRPVRIRRRPVRTSGWSSTRRTRITRIRRVPPKGCARRPSRCRRRRWRGRNRRGARPVRPCRGGPGRSRSGSGRAGAGEDRVEDPDGHVVRADPHTDVDGCTGRVLDRVGQRLLHHPVGGEARGQRHLAQLAFEVEPNLETGPLEPVDELGDVAGIRGGWVLAALAEQAHRAVDLGHGSPASRLGVEQRRHGLLRVARLEREPGTAQLQHGDGERVRD